MGHCEIQEFCLTEKVLKITVLTTTGYGDIQHTVDGCEILHQLRYGLSQDVYRVSTIQGGAPCMAFYHILPTSGSLFGVNAATWYVYHILYGACGRDYDQIGQAIYIYIYIYV